MNNNYRYLVLSVIATIVGFGIWIFYEDHQEIFRAIAYIGWPGFLWLCLFSMVNYGLRYARWRWLLAHLGDRAHGLDSVVCYISGYALTTTPAKVGETIRCLYFKRRHGIHYGHTLAAILTERTTDAVASTFIAGFAFYGFQHLGWLGVGFVVFILGVLLIVLQPGLLIAIAQWMRRIPIVLLHKLLDLVPVFLQRSATLFSFRPFLMGTVIAFFAWASEAYAFAWLAHELGGPASLWMYMSIFALAMVAGALTFMPGGLGSAEAVLFLLMKATGMGDAEAITATLLCRLATLWFAVGLGLLSLLWLEAHPKDYVADEVNRG